MKLSVVATLYRTASHLEEFHRRASAAARQLAGDDYEIVLVNDGSPDDSLEIALRLVAADPRLAVVDLSRNFGHHKAMMTGLAHARGDRVFLIDSDLEEEPEWLREFAARMEQGGGDVVYGVQARRRGGWFERWSGHCFYALFNSLAGIGLPENVVTARLMSRRYVEALLRHQEREVMIAGLWHITGFRQAAMPVDKHSTSATSYSLGRKLEVLVNAITSFSNKPLYFIFHVGLAILGVALLFIACLVYRYFFLDRPLGGWTSVIASIWLLGGITISFVGILAIYVSKIFAEVKQRPYTIVREVFRGDNRPGNGGLS